MQAVDEHCIRLTLVDWLIGRAAGYDLVIAWSNIEAALIATPEHDAEEFSQRAAKWENAMTGESGNKESEE